MAVDAVSVIRKLLVDDAAVSAIVGTQVYPQSAPQSKSPPYVILSRIDSENFHNMKEASGLVKVRVQIDSFSRVYADVADLADKVRLALDGFQNKNVTVGSDTARVDSIWMMDHEDSFEQPADATDDGFHRRIQDVEIMHDEVVPTFV